MERTWVDTKEMEKRKDSLAEKIKALKENFQEIQEICQKRIEEMPEEKRNRYEKRWTEQKKNGDEILDNLEYLERMTEFAVNRYHSTEEQMLALLQEIAD